MTTIPLLSIPVINRPDLLARCIASIDAPIGRLVVIDNSPTGGYADIVAENVPGCVADWFVCEPPANLGVAASWNLAIRTHPDLPWWAFANADTEFGPGDLARLAEEMTKPGPRWVGVNGDWRLMGLSHETVETVGLFDENFFPCYLEDCDYERRCFLAGVPWHFIDGGSTHVGSAAINSDARYQRANQRTWRSNHDHFIRKWGGPPRGGERFTTPFGSGAPLASWTLDIRRLRDNDWDRVG